MALAVLLTDGQLIEELAGAELLAGPGNHALAATRGGVVDAQLPALVTWVRRGACSRGCLLIGWDKRECCACVRVRHRVDTQGCR